MKVIRSLKGKRKGIRARDHARERREEGGGEPPFSLAPSTHSRAPKFPLPLSPFNACHAGCLSSSRLALRAKCRVRLAWLPRRRLCRLPIENIRFFFLRSRLCHLLKNHLSQNCKRMSSTLIGKKYYILKVSFKGRDQGRSSNRSLMHSLLLQKRASLLDNHLVFP